MQTIKDFLNKIPATLWVIIIIIVLLCGYFFKEDISSWWRNSKNAAADAKQVELQNKVDQLTKQRDDAITAAKVAEAKEQVEAQKADVLKQSIDQSNTKLKAEAQKLDDIANQYKTDQGVIDAAGRGEITKFDLCQKQCDDGKALGYPCRPNYCIQFQGK